MVLLAVFTIFAISGICEFIYILRLMICFPGTRIQNYSFVVLQKGFAIKELVFLWQKIKWQGDEFASGIVAITDNLDCVELSECEKFIDDKNILLCTSENINECIEVL